MMIWRRALGTIICIAIYSLSMSPLPCMAAKNSIKTSFKRYAVYPYKDRKVLCEPYLVAKDEWLYKIFRQKGEISEKDFPLFLAIFKTLNPTISNIDTINPGQTILIPLKTIPKEDFDETVPGSVDVPVVEFDTLKETPPPHFKHHIVKKGDTVSQLLDPVFLNIKGTLTEQGLQVFKLANPDIKDIHQILEGSVLRLPPPTLASTYLASSFPSILEKVIPPEPMSAETIARLERYTEVQNGELVRTGKYYFPAKGPQDLVLDLESTPMLILKDNARLILMQENHRDQKLEEAISNYWKEMTIVDIDLVLQNNKAIARPEALPEVMDERLNPKIISLNHNEAVKELLNYTGIDYISDAVISFSVGPIELSVKLLKIPRPGRSDLVVEYGDIYGSALDFIRGNGYEVLSFLPGETISKIAAKLFSSLGMAVVEEPAFISDRTNITITIPGIYIVSATQKILVTEKLLDLETSEFLKQRGISLLHTITPSYGT